MHAAPSCGHNLELQQTHLLLAQDKKTCRRKRVEDKGKIWIHNVKLRNVTEVRCWQFESFSHRDDATTKVHILVFHYYKSCQHVSSGIRSWKGVLSCIKNPQLTGNAFTFSAMRKLWTIFPNLFLPLATLCQTGRHRVEKLQLSLSPTGAKKCVHFQPIALTPAAFAWVASRALTESLLFLQSSQIDLIINRYSEQIQVFFISRKHLLSQTRECLAGKHRQRTLRSGLPELIW